MLFERNALTYGQSISHTEDSADFVIEQPGVYTLTFNGGFAPASGASLPFNLNTSAQLDGVTVPGASAQHNFTSQTDVVNQTFTVPFEVMTVPATLQVVSTADSFLYSNISATLTRNGDIPAALSH